MKTSSPLMNPRTRGAANVYSSYFSADTFVAPRHDGMTVEVSTSDRYTNSKPSPHITLKSIVMCNNPPPTIHKRTETI